MLLRELDEITDNIKVCLIQTQSKKMEMFLWDKIKSVCKSNRDTTFELVTKKDIKTIKSISNIEPPMANKWLVSVDLKKFGVNKDLIELIKTSTTAVFFCKSDRYMNYKKLKDECKSVDFVYDFYLSSLRRNDLLYLYTSLVPVSNQMTKQLFDYVAQSYSGDIEAVFDLFDALKSGTKVAKRTDISDICGLGGNTIESFVFSLLKQPPVTPRGINTVTRNRIRAGSELMDVYNSMTFYNYINNALKCILDIKMLCMSGIVYKQIINLPECYDEKKLSRYQRYLWKIKDIPTSRVLRCKTVLNLNTGWNSKMDLLKFLYDYMLDLQKYEVIPFASSLVVKEEIESDITVVEDDESKAKDFEDFKESMKLDYSGDGVKERYNELVKNGLALPVKEDNFVKDKDAVKVNEAPANALFNLDSILGDDEDTRSAMDLALMISNSMSSNE